MSDPKEGDPAPDFTLPASDGKPVTLADARGKRNVVLVFFPAAFTTVCTKEMCEFRDAVPRLGPLDADVYGISRDPVEKLAAFSARYELASMRLLSDASGEASARFGALSFLGHSKRATFVVDKAGVIRWRQVQIPFFRPDPEDVRAALERLRDPAAR